MIVKALEENGAKVYIVGRRKEVLEKVAKEEAVRLNIMKSSYNISNTEGRSMATSSHYKVTHARSPT